MDDLPGKTKKARSDASGTINTEPWNSLHTPSGSVGMTLTGQDGENINFSVLPAGLQSSGPSEEVFNPSPTQFSIHTEEKLKVEPTEFMDQLQSEYDIDGDNDHLFDGFDDTNSTRYRNPGDQFTAIVKLANHVDAMDSDSIMQVVESKILESFSTWDLIIRRSKLYQFGEEAKASNAKVPNLIQLLLSEIESLIQQLGRFLTDYMEPIESHDDEEDFSCCDDVVDVNEVLSAALGIVRGPWKVVKPVNSLPERFKQLFSNASSKFSSSNLIRKRMKRKRVKLNEEDDYDVEHDNDRMFNVVCERCSVPLLNDDALANHKTVCNGQSAVPVFFIKESATNFQCKMQSCGLSFQTEPEVITHCYLQHYDAKLRACVCNKCGAKFSSPKLRRKHDLQNHIQTKLEEEEVDIEEYDKNRVYAKVCDMCQTPLLNDGALASHKRICEGQSEVPVFYAEESANNFKCKILNCDASFTTESEVITHCYFEHYDAKLRACVCHECGAKFSSPSLRKKHHLQVHEKKFICPECGRRFWTERLLNEHAIKHTGQKPYKCNLDNCGYATTTMGLLRKHKKRHDQGVLRTDHPGYGPLSGGTGGKSRLPKYDQPRNNRYNVTLRDVQTPLIRENLDDIVIKKEQYDPNSKLPYWCDRCNHVYAHFATEYALKIHMKYCTGSNKNKEHCLWTCDGGCGKEFFYLRSLKDHRPKCDGIKTVSAQWKRSPVNGEYMCGVPGCKSNETWIGMYGLRQHFFAEHVTEEDKIFKCDHCEARFAYRTMKNQHMRKFHLRQHVCSYCGRAFAEKHKLRDHQFMHTGEKPFACEYCEYRAAKKYNLDAHKISKHGDTSGRSFFCETCGKSFFTKSNLRGHITVVHEGGRAINLNNGETRKKV